MNNKQNLTANRFYVYIGVAIIMLFFVAASCKKDDTKVQAKTVSAEPEKAKKIDFSKYDTKWDDMARFFAGLPVDSTSSLNKLFKTKAWRNHADSFDASWARLKKDRLVPLESWRDSELNVFDKNAKTLFYPFGGPDFTFAYQFFPQMETYIQLGLEPVSPIPDLATFDQNYLNTYLTTIRSAIGTLVTTSFFHTTSMGQDFSPGHLNGVGPVLLLFIVRNGNKVLNVEYFTVDKNGYFEEFPDPAMQGKDTKTEEPAKSDKPSKNTKVKQAQAENKINAIKITFTDSYGQDLKYLYYFSTNLGDSPYRGEQPFRDLQSFPDSKGLQEFFKSKKPFIAMAKSASYLMHYTAPTFNGIRTFITDNAVGYLQEDSGMPIKYLNNSNWDLKFYGVYTTPIPLFAGRFEQDLYKLFRDTSRVTGKLTFGVGYHPEPGTSNLTRAVRKTK